MINHAFWMFMGANVAGDILVGLIRGFNDWIVRKIETTDLKFVCETSLVDYKSWALNHLLNNESVCYTFSRWRFEVWVHLDHMFKWLQVFFVETVAYFNRRVVWPFLKNASSNMFKWILWNMKWWIYFVALVV